MSGKDSSKASLAQLSKPKRPASRKWISIVALFAIVGHRLYSKLTTYKVPLRPQDFGSGNYTIAEVS
jgi:hypothetical protein